MSVDYGDVYSDVYGAVYPNTRLELMVELLLGSTWTDISSYAYNSHGSPGATITRGHADESTVTNASTLTMVINNGDGRFSSRNPTGPYYGKLGRNTQVRVSVPEGATYLRSETDQVSYASAPSTVSMGTTTDVEIQVDVTLDNWAADTMLAAKWAQTGGNRTWMLLLNDDGTLTFKWSLDGTAVSSATSTIAAPVPGLRRQAIKATLATATGTVKFWTAPAGADQVVSGPITSGWVQLGASVVTGATAMVQTTAPVQVGYFTDAATDAAGYTGYQGKFHSFKLLVGIGGSTKASPDFTAQITGATSFTDAQANTWSLSGTCELSSRRYRFHGEVSAWPQAWDPTGTDVYVSVTASGPLRRLNQGNAPVASAMYRYWTKLTSPVPMIYWPCEDLASSTTLAAAIGVTPLTINGSATLASSTAAVCSAALPVLKSSIWTGIVPYSAGADNVVTLLVAVPSGGDTNNSCVMSVYTTGSAARIDLCYTTASGGQLLVNAYDHFGLFYGGTSSQNGVNGLVFAVRLAVRSDGAGGINVSQETLTPGGARVVQTVNIASASVGVINQIVVNSGTQVGGAYLTGTAVGHIAVQSTWASLNSLASPLNAWSGEAAGVRFSRLCSEEGLAFRGAGQLDASVPMGNQTQQTLVALLQECEDADRGTMFEPRQVTGLGYRTRYSLQNQAAAAALNYAAAHLAGTLSPTDDDLNTHNDVTVTRTGGSSSRQVLTSGALSNQAPPNGVGSYATALTVNTASDAALPSEAGWMLHVGTVNEPRYPLIQLDLARTEIVSMFYDLQDCDIGDRVTVSSTPVWLPPDGITQLIQGLTERLGGFIYQLDWNGVPEAPYKTLVVSDAVFGHVDTDGSALHANISSGATSMQVDTTTATPPYPLWTTSDVPFDVVMGGERITVTAISGGSSPQTFTITRAVNGVSKAHTAGEAVALFYPATISL